MPGNNIKPVDFSFVLIMLRLEKRGLHHLERELGEEDEAYLRRTKVAFPGIFDDVFCKPRKQHHVND